MKFNDMKKRVKNFDVKIEMFDGIAISYDKAPIYATSFYAENRNILMKELRQNFRKRDICKPDLSKIMRTANEASTAYLNSSESNETTHVLFYANDAFYRITFTCYAKRLKKTPPVDRVNARGENIFEKRLRQNGSDKLLHRYNEARKVANNLDIEYAAPVSEKQMTGQLPYGTVVHGSNSDTISPAIWWTDYEGHRTDIDIHLNSKNGSFGWNSDYRRVNKNSNILYSGDMTSANPYASEAFRITLDDDEAYILTACLFDGSYNAPFKFMLTDVDFTKGAPINVEDALFSPIDMKFNNTRNMSLGFVRGNSFYFYGGELGKRITPDVELNNRALDAMITRVSNMFKLDEFINLGGGRVIRDISEVEDDAEVISLEPNAITANTLFDIVD